MRSWNEIENKTKMKRYSRLMIMAASAAMLLIAFASCDTADELPPLNDGYATTVVMPAAEDLTSEDRDYIQELQDEYNEAIAND